MCLVNKHTQSWYARCSEVILFKKHDPQVMSPFSLRNFPYRVYCETCPAAYASLYCASRGGQDGLVFTFIVGFHI